MENQSDKMSSDVVTVFTVFQWCIILVSIGLGVAAMGRMIKIGCKNRFTIIAILFFGFVHELYAVYSLETARNKHQIVCVDFYPICLTAVVLILWTSSLSAMRVTFSHTTWTRALYISLIYVGVAIPVVIRLRPDNSSGNEDSIGTLKIKTALLYVTVCDRDPRRDMLALTTEYLALYLPFLCLYMAIYKTQKSSFKEAYFAQIQCLAPCQEGDCSPYHCRTCARLNPVFAISLLYYITALIILRPIFIAYSLVFGTLYKDFLPNLVICSLYVLLTIYCTFDLHISLKVVTKSNTEHTVQARTDYSPDRSDIHTDIKMTVQDA